MSKTTYEFEAVLAVADYWNAIKPEPNSVSDAFETCMEDFDAARESAMEEFKEAEISEDLLKRVKVKVLNFIEFDSRNPSHAGGYFLVEVTGKKKDIEEVKKLDEAWLNEGVAV